MRRRHLCQRAVGIRPIGTAPVPPPPPQSRQRSCGKEAKSQSFSTGFCSHERKACLAWSCCTRHAAAKMVQPCERMGAESMTFPVAGLTPGASRRSASREIGDSGRIARQCCKGGQEPRVCCRAPVFGLTSISQACERSRPGLRSRSKCGAATSGAACCAAGRGCGRHLLMQAGRYCV